MTISFGMKAIAVSLAGVMALGATTAVAQKVKMAVARKLAVILHRMWCDGTDFIWSNKEVAA